MSLELNPVCFVSFNLFKLQLFEEYILSIFKMEKSSENITFFRHDKLQQLNSRFHPAQRVY